MGDGYGPMVVARAALAEGDLRGRTILIPGERTTAFLVLNLMLGRGAFRHRVVMFDQILDAVAAGEADAGLIIHEGSSPTDDRNYIGWWTSRLVETFRRAAASAGGNCIRRSLEHRPSRRLKVCSSQH